MYSDESSEASDGGQDARKKALQTALPARSLEEDIKM